MTDLEMTKLCAEAMGLRQAPIRPIPPPPAPQMCALRVSPGKKADFWYYPLHNDAQMAALVKKFRLSLDFDDELDPTGVWVVQYGYTTQTSSPDLNSAVVEYVAYYWRKRKSPQSGVNASVT